MSVLAKGMMVIGVLLLLLPSVGQRVVQYEQRLMYKDYQQSMMQMTEALEVMNETLETGITDVEQSNLEVDEVDEVDEVASGVYTANGVAVMGLIDIPKIEVSILLVEGVSNQDLKYAAGHMPGTAIPGEVGNCSIAGHRSYTFGQYFNRLDELEEGDEIRINYGTKEYVYEVYESFLVLPTEIAVIESQGDEAVVTLITCHPVINPTHRLIVRGKLVKD